MHTTTNLYFLAQFLLLRAWLVRSITPLLSGFSPAILPIYVSESATSRAQSPEHSLKHSLESNSHLHSNSSTFISPQVTINQSMTPQAWSALGVIIAGLAIISKWLSWSTNSLIKTELSILHDKLNDKLNAEISSLRDKIDSKFGTKLELFTEKLEEIRMSTAKFATIERDIDYLRGKLDGVQSEARTGVHGLRNEMLVQLSEVRQCVSEIQISVAQIKRG